MATVTESPTKAFTEYTESMLAAVEEDTRHIPGLGTPVAVHRTGILANAVCASLVANSSITDRSRCRGAGSKPERVGERRARGRPTHPGAPTAAGIHDVAGARASLRVSTAGRLPDPGQQNGPAWSRGIAPALRGSDARLVSRSHGTTRLQAKDLHVRIGRGREHSEDRFALRFKIPESEIRCGDTEATLTGKTIEGQSFAGTDVIRTVGCKKK